MWAWIPYPKPLLAGFLLALGRVVGVRWGPVVESAGSVGCGGEGVGADVAVWAVLGVDVGLDAGVALGVAEGLEVSVAVGAGVDVPVGVQVTVSVAVGVGVVDAVAVLIRVAVVVGRTTATWVAVGAAPQPESKMTIRQIRDAPRGRLILRTSSSSNGSCTTATKCQAEVGITLPL